MRVQTQTQELLHRRRLGRRRLLGLAGGTVAATMFGRWGLDRAWPRRARSASLNQQAGFGHAHPRSERPPRPAAGLPVPGALAGRRQAEQWRDGPELARRHGRLRRPRRHHDPGPQPRDHQEPQRRRRHSPGHRQKPYGTDVFGGTTAVIVDTDRSELQSFVTSSGTVSNCAGGATPWGTWLTCEEATSQGLKDEDGITTLKPHGYVFEVDPSDPENVLSRTPIKEMGVFSHEAIGYRSRHRLRLPDRGWRDRDRPDRPAQRRRRQLPLPLHPQRPEADARGAAAGRHVAGAEGGRDCRSANDADLFDPGQRFGVHLGRRRSRGPDRGRDGQGGPASSTASRARTSRAAHSGSATRTAASSGWARSSATSRPPTPWSSSMRATTAPGCPSPKVTSGATSPAWRIRTTSPLLPGAMSSWRRTAAA